MYSGSSGRLGSLVMPLRLSVLAWYWSITHSRAERLPRRYSKVSGGMPSSVRKSLIYFSGQPPCCLMLASISVINRRVSSSAQMMR